MMDTMYELPSMPEITRCLIDEKAVNKLAKPTLFGGEDAAKKHKPAHRVQAEESQALPIPEEGA